MENLRLKDGENSLRLSYFREGNCAKVGPCTKKELAKKVYISCGYSYDSGSVVLTIPQTKRLIKVLKEIINLEKGVTPFTD